MNGNSWREHVKRTEPGSAQWYSTMGQEAMGKTWNIGGSLWTLEITLSLWGWQSTGTCCPVSLWSLCFQRSSHELCALAELGLRNGAGVVISRGTFEPQIFCDFLKILLRLMWTLAVSLFLHFCSHVKGWEFSFFSRIRHVLAQEMILIGYSSLSCRAAIPVGLLYLMFSLEPLASAVTRLHNPWSFLWWKD